ncbi:MAG TPA: cupin domain-containing protein [Candidatus Binatia bacterium]|nr:cupin domain-containing protein [Candidatus Binatia bacterium]
MVSLAEASKAARLALDPYKDWVEREGIAVYEGVGCDLPNLETKPWPRYGVNGVAVHLTGKGDFANLFAIDIPGGASTNPQRHLYEEVVYVIEGRGSTQIELPDGRKRSFEWQPRSMFAIPLNAKHRFHNGSGQERALLASVTSLPMMLKLFHNDGFIFNNDYFFEDRIGKDSYYEGEGDLMMVRAGHNIWETNFVHDLSQIELTAWAERGAGATNLRFMLADGNMHAHISEIQTGTYKKAHRHGPGAHIFTVTGKGYSLLWVEGDKDFSRVDWSPGMVFAPIDKQFHQHFTTSTVPSRYLAVIGGSNARYPLTEALRRVSSADDGSQGQVSTSIKLGGSQVEYEDQDPRIHEMWLDEMRKAGITPQFDKYEGAAPALATAR